MIKIERTITIHRPVDEVFAYLCDVEHGPRYISGQGAAHVLKSSAGPMGIGTRFVTTGKLVPRRAISEVTEFEPNRRLAWKGTSGAQATTTWGFQSTGGSTRVTFTRVAEPRGMFRLSATLMQALANARVDRDLATLKELLAVTRKPAARGW